MTASIIDGKAIAADLRGAIATAVAALKPEITPGLAVVLVGDDPASQVYVRSKGKASREVGLASYEHRLPAGTAEADLLGLIDQLNTDESVDGILVQLPLPPHMDAAAVIDRIAPDKDVDGFHVINAGRLATGQTSLVPCTPFGSMILLRKTLGDISGKHAVVLGRSNIVGKPMAQLLLNANATVTIAHSRTADLPGLCRQADILVAAVGRPHMVQGDWVKPGATVIDVGINRIPAPEKGDGKTRLVGDVDYAAAAEVASAITPVPGGVGPMTIACLLRNAVVAACLRNGRAIPAVLNTF
ncbi:MAG: bifunctional methylenetetrahydrofolate dehydrogenase/methenyltetrahydrofolate cyclohydrolase FolD [Pseudomonadota bacterium]